MAKTQTEKKPGVRGAMFEKNKDGSSKRCSECGQAVRVKGKKKLLTMTQIEKRKARIANMQKNLATIEAMAALPKK